MTLTAMGSVAQIWSVRYAAFVLKLLRDWTPNRAQTDDISTQNQKLFPIHHTHWHGSFTGVLKTLILRLSFSICFNNTSSNYVQVNYCLQNDAILLASTIILRPKKNPVFRATQPYLSELADTRLFYENTVFFFVGVFIIEVSILKKNTWLYLKFLRLLP